MKVTNEMLEVLKMSYLLSSGNTTVDPDDLSDKLFDMLSLIMGDESFKKWLAGEESESGYCPTCNGSGEGLHENTTCLTCNGHGELYD